MGFHHVGWAGLKLLTSNDSPTSASQGAGITGVNQLCLTNFYYYYKPEFSCRAHLFSKLFCAFYVPDAVVSTWSRVVSRKKEKTKKKFNC